MKYLLFVLLAMVSSVSAATFEVQSTKSAANVLFDVTIEGKDVAGLGALQFAVLWDGDAAVFQDAELAPGLNGLVDVKGWDDGRLRVHVALSNPVETDGPLLTMKGLSGLAPSTSEVRLEDVRAWSFEPLLELEAMTKAGQLTIGDESSAAPTPERLLLYFVGGVVVLLVLVTLVRRPRS